MEEDNKDSGISPIILGLLDPVSEAIEKGLNKVGLGKIASSWIKGESTVLLLGLLNAMKEGGSEYLTQTTGPAVMNLSTGKKIIQENEFAGIDAAIAALEGLVDTMELSPSYQIDEAVKKSTGKYGNEWLAAGVGRLRGMFNES
jgi:hypothetical protein